MPKLDLALEKEGPTDLRVEWSPGFKSVWVTYVDHDILHVENKQALVDGASVTLSDGSTLSVRLLSPFVSPALEVLRDGFPVPGSHTHPTSPVKSASTLLYVFALLTLLSGLLSASKGTVDAGGLVGFAIEAALFAGFGYFTRKLKPWALFCGTGLYAIESVFVFVGLVSVGEAATVVGSLVGFVLWRAFVFRILGRGIKAFRDLDKRDPNEAVAVFR